MRLFASVISLFVAVAALAAEPVWLTDLDAAKAQGVKENKPVLVDFTGSDWCPPCKALHKNVFMSAEFAAVASKYVLVELDYPRTKTQAPELKAKNAELSKQFGITGFPTVLLLDARSGDVFGKTVGFGGQSAKEYLDKLASFKNTPEGMGALER
jgi:thiol:disulfide interchange protein